MVKDPVEPNAADPPTFQRDWAPLLRMGGGGFSTRQDTHIRRGVKMAIHPEVIEQTVESLSKTSLNSVSYNHMVHNQHYAPLLPRYSKATALHALWALYTHSVGPISPMYEGGSVSNAVAGVGASLIFVP